MLIFVGVPKSIEGSTQQALCDSVIECHMSVNLLESVPRVKSSNLLLTCVAVLKLSANWQQLIS